MIELVAVVALILVLCGFISFGAAAMLVGKLVIGGIILSIAVLVIAAVSSR